MYRERAGRVTKRVVIPPVVSGRNTCNKELPVTQAVYYYRNVNNVII
jgi:hypothetical protein